LTELRPLLGATVTQIHPHHANWPVSAIRFDEVTFTRPIEIFRDTPRFVFHGGQGGAGSSTVVGGEGLNGSAAIKYDGIPTNIWKRINALDFSAQPLATGSLTTSDVLTISIDAGNAAAPVDGIRL